MLGSKGMIAVMGKLVQEQGVRGIYGGILPILSKQVSSPSFPSRSPHHPFQAPLPFASVVLHVFIEVAIT